VSRNCGSSSLEVEMPAKRGQSRPAAPHIVHALQESALAIVNCGNGTSAELRQDNSSGGSHARGTRTHGTRSVRGKCWTALLDNHGRLMIQYERLEVAGPERLIEHLKPREFMRSMHRDPSKINFLRTFCSPIRVTVMWKNRAPICELCGVAVQPVISGAV
jgi:hypothetical protein